MVWRNFAEPGKSSRGLAFFEGGREYYIYLLRSQTGTYVPVKRIEQRLSSQLLSDYQQTPFSSSERS